VGGNNRKLLKDGHQIVVTLLAVLASHMGDFTKAAKRKYLGPQIIPAMLFKGHKSNFGFYRTLAG
jgi:hypothetical protein